MANPTGSRMDTATSTQVDNLTINVKGVEPTGNAIVGWKAGSASGNGATAHGLTGTPNFVGLTPTAAASTIEVSSIGTTNITITMGTAGNSIFASTIA